VGRVQVVNLSVLAGEGVEGAVLVSVNIRVFSPIGSRIRNGKKPIRDKHPDSYFRQLTNNFFVVKNP
jgi:hypothetical protein